MDVQRCSQVGVSIRGKLVPHRASFGSPLLDLIRAESAGSWHKRFHLLLPFGNTHPVSGRACSQKAILHGNFRVPRINGTATAMVTQLIDAQLLRRQRRNLYDDK